jgi:hypothetical protein
VDLAGSGGCAHRITVRRRWEEPFLPLRRRPSVDRVVDEHEPPRPVRGSRLGKLYRNRKNPANVTAEAASQMITLRARTHGVDPNDITMKPAIATASPT